MQTLNVQQAAGYTSSSAIRNHVELIHSLATGSDGKFVVSVFNEGIPGTITQHRIGDVDGMVTAIEAPASTPGANVFTGLHLMRLDLPRGSRGSEKDIVAVLGLVADMDADTGKVGTMPVEASYVVETSPGNSQPVILFDAPMAPADAKPLAKALRRASKSDFGTGDITHVWRIPGTRNYPNKAKIARGRSAQPAAVSISEPYVGLVYSKEALTAALEPFITDNTEPHNERLNSRVDATTLWPRLSDLGRAAIAADGQPDRSAHVARVVERLNHEGFTLDEIISMCCEGAGAWSHRFKKEAELIRDLERVWNKFIAPKEAEKKANAEAASNFIGPNSRAGYADGQPPRAVKATPFVFRDPKTIPQRESLYAGHFNRRFLSNTFGVGGGGKSTLVIADALAMASGLNLLGHQPVKALKVWYINLEDPADEIERRIAAAALHYALDPEILNKNLFVDSGRDQEFVVLKNIDRQTKVIEPVVSAIIQEMKDNCIDVLIIDPFISTHEVEENDNSKIQQVAAQFVKIANDANVAVELVHHVNKAVGDGKNEVTADSGRGASALKDKARSVRVINGMSAEEAVKAGIDPNERFSYFRVSNGKSNMKKRSGQSEWRVLASVNLRNGAWWEPGDSVGVAIEWKWPSNASLADTITPIQLDEIKSDIRAGHFKANAQARAWAGKVFAKVLGFDLADKASKSLIARIMAAHVDLGHFEINKRRDGDKREPKPFFEVCEVPHLDSSGAGKVLH